ncbi:MAG: hypothetical protein KDD27_16465 [Saprospiraceae bacterium]|nr:hypothetical protein [Saprospiraceae bacterium]
MDNPLDRIEDTFELEMPARESLDDSIDAILPKIRPLSEDLREQQFYSMPGGKPWLEIRDDPSFLESVLHFFNVGGEYLLSVDGNVTRGRWRLLDGTNKIIIEQGGGGKSGGKGGSDSHWDKQDGGGDKQPSKSELYELAFLNKHFFILKKHGDQKRKGNRKYLVLGFEPAVKGLKWKDIVELMYDDFRGQWGTFHYLVIGAIILGAIIAFFSLR